MQVQKNFSPSRREGEREGVGANALGMIVIVVLGLALLGAGCRPQPPASPSNATSAQPTNTVPASASDPLADDLDAAIEDLNAIE